MGEGITARAKPNPEPKQETSGEVDSLPSILERWEGDGSVSTQLFHICHSILPRARCDGIEPHAQLQPVNDVREDCAMLGDKKEKTMGTKENHARLMRDESLALRWDSGK